MELLRMDSMLPLLYLKCFTCLLGISTFYFHSLYIYSYGTQSHRLCYVVSTLGPIASSLNVDGLFQSSTWAMNHEKKRANQKRKEKSEGWKSNSDSASCPEFLSMLVSPLRSWWECGLYFCLWLDGWWMFSYWSSNHTKKIVCFVERSIWCDYLIGH